MQKKLLTALLFVFAAAISASAQEIEVNRYQVSAKIDVAASAIDVHASLNITNLGASAKPKLYFRIAKLAKVSSVTVNGGSATVEAVDDRRATTLSQLTVTPAASLAAGASAPVEFNYRIEAPESSPLIHVYAGEVFLAPEAVWVPMPSTFYTLYGPTTAPATTTISISGASQSFRAASSGTGKSDASGFSFEQPLNTIPMLVAGEFDQPLSSDLGGVKVEIWTQPGITPAFVDTHSGAGGKSVAARLSEEAGRAIDFLTRTLGPPPAGASFRIISSARASNIDTPGVLVLNEQVFRRDALMVSTIETVAGALAHLWIDGRVRIRGQEARGGAEGGPARKPRSAAFLRDSLPRYLATLYIEDRYGKEAGRDSFTRMRWNYTPVAQSGRDAELAVQTIILPNYGTAVLSKGPLVFRLFAELGGRDKLISAIKSLFSGPQTKVVTLEDLRQSIAKEMGASGDKLFSQWIDSIIEPNLIVGAPLPSDKPGTQRVNIRNLGTGDVPVQLVATTAANKQVSVLVLVPSENIVSAEIPTGDKITALELDPDKLIIQTSYDNDMRSGDFKNPRQSAITLFNSSIADFNKGQYADAESKLKQAVQLDQRNPTVHAWLARTLAAQKKFDEAAAEANAALKAEPPVASAVAWARISLGQVAMAKGQNAEAVENLRRGLANAEETPAQFAVRELLIQAERAANAAPPVDDAIRQYVSKLDAAIREPTSDKLFLLAIKNNLKRFVQGITVSHPSAWSTEILRSDRLDANRVALDVRITARTEGKDQSGTSVLVLYRGGGGWMLEDVQLFNVK